MVRQEENSKREFFVRVVPTVLEIGSRVGEWEGEISGRRGEVVFVVRQLEMNELGYGGKTILYSFFGLGGRFTWWFLGVWC